MTLSNSHVTPDRDRVPQPQVYDLHSRPSTPLDMGFMVAERERFEVANCILAYKLAETAGP